MVVLTFLLAKAAYDRFGSNSEIDVDGSDHQNDNGAGLRSTLQRAATVASFGRDSGHGRGHGQRREPSSRIGGAANTNSGHPPRNKGGTGRLPRSQSDVSLRNRSRNNNAARSSAARSSASDHARLQNFLKMSSANNAELVVPTRGGHFAVDPKAKALMLPPEPSDARTKGGEKGGAWKGVTSSRSNDPIEDAYNALAAASSEERERSNKFPLSSAEMNSAIMPEAASPDGTLTGMSIKVDSLEGAGGSVANGRNEGSIANEGRRIDTTNTTFRSDVRNEWVDAVFGKDFFPLNNGEGSRMTDKADMGVKQGTGAASISHYVTYGALLDASQSDNTGPPQTPNDRGPRDRPFLSTSIQSKAQSTPLYSPTLSGGGTLLASASLASLTPSACGGDLGGFGSGAEDGGGKSDPFATPSHANGEHRAASYTVDATPKTPGTQYSQLAPHHQRPKLGITVSRIPLGVYVSSISLESEAYAAGISPGSVLVDINGMGMLGERSDRALERLWRYAGLFGADTKGGEGSNGSVSKRDRASSIGQEDLDSSNKGSAGPDLQMKKPVQLRLYKNGRVYTVLLLSGKPLAGIDWAPCGNFALVHRVAVGSLAATAGVRRGTLVVGVDGEGMRTLDHAGVAGLLKEKFAKGESIKLSLGYTPAASRSGFREKEEKAQNGSANQMTSVTDGSPKDARSNTTANSMRDVEVRSRPVEYGAVVDTFFACTGPGAMGSVDDFESLERRKGLPPRSASASSLPNLNGAPTGMAEAAAYVGAGGIVPPGKILEAASSLASSGSAVRRTSPESGKGFGLCPLLVPEVLLGECWNPLASLARSMAYAASGCCETEYLQQGGPFERLRGGSGEAPSTPMECMAVIEAIGSNAPSLSGEAAMSAEEVFDAHLLQLLGVAIFPSMSATVEGGRRLSAMLMDTVIDVALNDINLCQRLFFVLRSFVASLEDQKLPHGFVGEQSALATRLCRYAQRRLSGRMFDKSAGVDGERHCSEGYPIERESTGASRTERMAQELSHLEIVASKSTESAEYPMQEPNVASPGPVAESSSAEDMPASHGSSRENYEQNSLALDSNDGSSATAKKKSKGKKILRMLKPKSIRGSKKATSDQSTTAPSTVNGNSTAPNSKKSPKTPHKSFTFTYPFHKNQLQTIDAMPPAPSISDAAGHNSISLSRKFENMAWILRQLDSSTAAIEKNLMKSFSQKFTDWALYPWSPSKESALVSVTASFRTELQLMNYSSSTGAEASTPEARFPVLNPVDPTELLTSVDAEECFILPSAHFPLLLCFNSVSHPGSPKSPTQSRKGGRNDVLYRTTIDVLGLESTLPPKANEAFAVQCAVAGVIQESGVSDASRRSQDSATYRWTTNSSLAFETRSNWGYPKAASLKLSTLSKLAGNPDEVDCRNGQTDLGCGFVDLCPLWKKVEEQPANSSTSTTKKIALFDSVEEFDQHGFLETLSQGDLSTGLELKLRITTTVVSFEEQPKKQKRLLLYKHGDDLRQELLAIQFIERCNQILLSSGLDLKLKTFSCQPVGSNTGFIEWVRGTVPLSELCKSSGSSEPGPATGLDSRQSKQEGVVDGEIAEYAAALESDVLGPQSHRWFKYQSLPPLRQKMNGSAADNPIQDFLRSAAYDENAPYMVKKDVMANYVKSCAGYCVITYLLGVGDRHLDNILLHQNGHLLHCDYSFILGQDPKTYLPMRITEEMIRGFGGRDSDNFAMFTSFTGAAFLTLRRHNNLHSLLSHICNMIHANMGDLSINQPPEEAILAMRGRFRLDLSDDDALAFIEDVVEKSISSKMWRAVDVMHSLGKHF